MSIDLTAPRRRPDRAADRHRDLSGTPARVTETEFRGPGAPPSPAGSEGDAATCLPFGPGRDFRLSPSRLQKRRSRSGRGVRSAQSEGLAADPEVAHEDIASALGVRVETLARLSLQLAEIMPGALLLDDRDARSEESRRSQNGCRAWRHGPRGMPRIGGGNRTPRRNHCEGTASHPTRVSASRQSLAEGAARTRTSWQERRIRLLLRRSGLGTRPAGAGIDTGRRTARQGATAGPPRVP